MSSLSLILALVCLSAGAAFGQATDCQAELAKVVSCVADAQKPPPNKPDLKKQLDECWTKNGCEAPKPPPPTAPVPIAAVKPAVVTQGDKCFQTVHNETIKALVTCMKKNDSKFELPKDGSLPPFIAPFGAGVGGPVGGPVTGPFSGPPPEQFRGPFVAGGPPPPPGAVNSPVPHPLPAPPPPPQCNNMQAVGSCLAGVFNKSQPTQSDLKAQFEQQCKIKDGCKKHLSSKCEAELKAKAKAACLCAPEVEKKKDSILSTEPSCKGVPTLPKPTNAKKPDCDAPPEDPCKEGYDAFIKRISAGANHPVAVPGSAGPKTGVSASASGSASASASGPVSASGSGSASTPAAAPKGQ